MGKITFYKNIFILLIFLLCGFFGVSQSTQTYPTSGSFIVPAGVTSVKVQAWGAGGGGSTITSSSLRGGGGGGGGYAETSGVSVNTIASPYNVTVGIGGAGNTAGGNSSFNGTSVVAGGGAGASANSATAGLGATTGVSTGTIKYAGGNGAAGGTTVSGGGGGGAGSGSNGVVAISGGGGNGGTGSGGDGADGVSGSNIGSNGSTFGGGGSGAVTNSTSDRNGGVGANGQVIVTYTCPTYALTGTTITTPPTCSNNAATVTLAGTLPVGTYTVSYTLSNANTGSQTATMTVSSSGSGTFNITNTFLVNAGTTSIRITNLQSSYCTNSIAANSASLTSITTVAAPAQPSTITGSATPCIGVAQDYFVTDATGTTYTWVLPSGWLKNSGGTTSIINVTPNSTGGNITVTPSNSCGSGTARILGTTPASVPTITGSTPNNRDGAGTVTLGATASAGTISWYSNSSGGSALPGATGTTTSSFVTPSLTATTIFYAETVNGSCTPSARTAVVATVNSATMNIQGNGNAIADGSTVYATSNFTDFGNVNTGTPKSYIYTIQNTGNRNLVLGTLTLSNTTDYKLTVYPTPTIAAGGSTYFVITFNPTTAVVKNATVSIVNNDPATNKDPYDFAITGTGVTAPEINVLGNGMVIIDGDITTSTTDYTDFGSKILLSPQEYTYTIENKGTSNLTISSTTLSDLTNYSLTSAPVSPVTPGSSTTFKVTFSPTTLGAKPATITIVTNDSDEATYDFAITGTGIAAPEMNVKGNSTDIVDNAGGTSLLNHTDFGSTNTGTPVSRTYSIENLATGNLTLGTITLSDNTNYTLTTSPNAMVTAGSPNSFTITFNPTTTGVKPATISIINNDSDENPYNFAITGTGIAAPEANIQGMVNSVGYNITSGSTATSAANATDFGYKLNTGTLTNTYTIQNTGTSSLTIGTIVLSNITDYSITAPSATVAAGASTTFVVTFKAGGTGVKTTTISIPTNDSNENPYNFTITGNSIAATGVTPTVNVRPTVSGGTLVVTSIPDADNSPSTNEFTHFDTNYINTPLSYSYTIENTHATSNLTIGTITFDGTNPGDFKVIIPPSTVIPPLGSTTFTVAFNATTAGTKNAMIHISTNAASPKNDYNFALRGIAIVPDEAQEIDVLGNGVSIPYKNTVTSTSDWTILGDTFVYTPITRTFTIKNLGTVSALALGSIGAPFVSGTDASSFSVTTTPTSLAPLGFTTFTVTFTPTSAGVKTAIINIPNDDLDEKSGTPASYSFAILGNAFDYTPSTEIDVQGIVNGTWVSIATASAASSSLGTDYGNNQIKTSPKEKIFTIRNYGGSDLILGGTPNRVTVSPSTDFTVTSQPSTPIASLGSTIFSIEFNPQTTGTKTATVTISNNNDPNENPYTFTIAGTGEQKYFDADNDGIFDNLDVDDDNDGIKDNTEEANCKNAIGYNVDYKFLNETFGAGTTRNSISGTTYIYEPDPLPEDVDDGEYAVASDAQLIARWAPKLWYKGTDHTPGDTDGKMAMFNASFTPGVFYSATISGVLPNIPITYSFWVINLDRTDAPGITTRMRPNIRVEFRDIDDNLLPGAVINTGPIAPTTAGNTSGDWYNFTANLTLSVDVFKVVFINNETGGAGNDLAIDDILITQSLCDRDGDGIADVFDLDSDNDGIPDVVETGLGQYSSGKGKMDAGTIGTDGLDTRANTLANSPNLDSDNDGVPNSIDLDSDNDSLFDVDESGAGNSNATTFENGDGDITGDGRGDGSDSELFRLKDSDGNGVNEYYGDGILDLYDKSPNLKPGDSGYTFASVYGNTGQGTATANPATTYLKNSDIDAIPDYLDLTSNGSTFDIAKTIALYDYKTLDSNNDGKIDDTTDIDKDGILDTFDTNTAYFGCPRDLRTKFYLDFDGRNDYAQDSSPVLLGDKGTLMAWIDITSTTGAGFIVGQDSFNLQLNASKQIQVTCKGTPRTYATALGSSRWYHVAATYDGTNVILYLNGKNVASAGVTGSIVDATKLTIGRSPSTSTNFFKGKIDEVRVFSIALTENQLQRMVYQEIDPLITNLKGTYITDKEIGQDDVTVAASLPFTTMLRYYRMDNYKDDIIDNLTTPTIDIDQLTGTKIYNHKIIAIQQAPMPFVTKTDNVDLATSITDGTKDIDGSDVYNYKTIVNIKNNVTTNADRTDVGLIIDAGKTLTVDAAITGTGSGLTNTWWLSLQGKIDLVGKSQLVQTITSDLASTTTGSIERDQQGQTNKFNYNYWSSPVSAITDATKNNGFTVAGVMKDGFSTTPRDITWNTTYDGVAGTAGTAVSLARYWLYIFDNKLDTYANWEHITETSALRAGQGYTLKGNGGATGTTNNLTFVGKPNNGTILSNTVSANQLLLVGNPYPSALNAYQFINDNATNTIDTSTDGNLYFWEHASDNSSHNLAAYKGRYSTLNNTGGVAGVVPDGISGAGLSAKAPKQYIPVGQGFFVYGKPLAGGAVNFNNGQRAFKKETDSESTTLFKTKANTKIPKVITDSEDQKPTYKKIRLGYNNADNYHRQVLIGFMDDKATSGIDYGYDAEIMDDFPNDMYFLNSGKELIIQGESYFDVNASYPIGIKADKQGKVNFVIDELENFDPEQPIYIHDNVTNTYHDIRIDKFEIELPNLPAPQVNNRFSLRFTDKTLSINENAIEENAITIVHLQKGNVLEINNQLVDTTIEKLTLYTITGQSIASWEIENQGQTKIQIPLKNNSTGVYIAKIKTSKGVISKKIIIK